MATTLLSFVAIILLPRQFHVAVVENNNEDEIKRAAWLFPVYLVLINLFVVPIALAGLLTFRPAAVDSDMFVLALPLQTGSNLFTIAAFVGGLSAATAMVIVESVALSIMVSNDIVMPLVLQRREATDLASRENIGSLLLTVRRLGDLRASCCSPISTTARPATRSSPRSACCRSRPSRNWRRRFSAA